jgi:hypothetical protein
VLLAPEGGLGAGNGNANWNSSVQLSLKRTDEFQCVYHSEMGVASMICYCSRTAVPADREVFEPLT